MKSLIIIYSCSEFSSSLWFYCPLASSIWLTKNLRMGHSLSIEIFICLAQLWVYTVCVASTTCFLLSFISLLLTNANFMRSTSASNACTTHLETLNELSEISLFKQVITELSMLILQLVLFKLCSLKAYTFWNCLSPFSLVTPVWVWTEHLIHIFFGLDCFFFYFSFPSSSSSSSS